MSPDQVAEPAYFGKWPRLANGWFESSPPAVPSPEDLEVFQRLTGSHEAGTAVVILGCTPSLRAVAQVASRRKDPVFLVDLSPEMVSESVRIMPLEPNEVVHHAGWMQTGLVDSMAGTVIGDKALDNIRAEQWPNLFRELGRICSYRGLLVQHIGLDPPRRGVPDALEIRTYWSRRLESNEVNLDDAAAGLWEDLLTHSASFSSGAELSIASWGDRLADAGVRADSEDSLIRRFYDQFGSSLDDSWTSIDWPLVASCSGGMFALTDVVYSSDYRASPDQPIIALLRVNDPAEAFPSEISLAEMVDLESRGCWGSIEIVSGGLGHDTGGSLREVVLANTGNGVTYRYIVPSSLRVLPALVNLGREAGGSISVVEIDAQRWSQQPALALEHVVYTAHGSLRASSIVYREIESRGDEKRFRVLNGSETAAFLHLVDQLV